MTASILVCPDCGAPMVLKPSRYGQFYGCSRWSDTGCRGSHGAHPDGRPMGTPANAETKRARIEAHAAFDRLWKNGRMSRKRAYRWLRVALNLPKERAHISMFDVPQCEQLIRRVERELGVLRS